MAPGKQGPADMYIVTARNVILLIVSGHVHQFVSCRNKFSITLFKVMLSVFPECIFAILLETMSKAQEFPESPSASALPV